MKIISQILIGLVAIEHLYILWIEMFAWTTVGKKILKNEPDNFYDKTKVLAKNQGLYNGFLAAGLIWSLLICDPVWSQNIAFFFLGCVMVAGVYGTFMASKSIFYIQALPAILALVFVFFAN